MEARLYLDPVEFLAAHRAFLESAEPCSSLMLGITMRTLGPDISMSGPPFFAAVLDGEREVLLAIRTPPHALQTFAVEKPPREAAELLDDALGTLGDSIPAILGPDYCAEICAAVWAERRGRRVSQSLRQRVFELTRVEPPWPIGGFARAATLDDIPLLTEWAVAFNSEATNTATTEAQVLPDVLRRVERGDLLVWDDGEAVSMASAARPTRRVISVNLVYTPPHLRGRGYASSCVAALSQRLLDLGWERCSLFTDLENATSNHIYQAIGFKPVCDFSVFSAGELRRARRRRAIRAG